MGSARKRISRGKLRRAHDLEASSDLLPAQTYQERRWFLDCFYRLNRCFPSLEKRNAFLPKLVHILKPRIKVRMACFLEQRDHQLLESLWHLPQVPAHEVVQLRIRAEAHFRYLTQGVPLASDREPSQLFNDRLIVLPMVVSQGPIFGVLCLQCLDLNESYVTLLHALGNHIALALEHHYQLDLQKKAKVELESLAQFKKLAESLPEMVWTIDSQGAFTYANRRLIQYTELDPALAKGKAWMELCHPDDRQALQLAWKDAVTRQCTFEIEHRIRRSDGTYRWFLSRAVPDLEGTGQTQGWIGTCTDIHEKRRANEQLESVNSRLRLLSEVASDLMRTGPSQLMIEKALGKISAQLPYDAFLSLVLDPASHTLRPLAHGGIPADLLPRVQTRTWDINLEASEFFQSLGMTSSASFPLVSQERVVGLLLFASHQPFSQDEREFMRTVCDQVAVALDRTLNEEAKEQARKDLEKAKIEADSANQAKSLFLANMSHEIRTPIGVILGFADLALSPSYSEADRLVALQKIKRNGKELAQLIDDILDLTKVETGHLEIEKKAVEMEELLQQLTSLLHFKASEKGIALTIRTAPDVPARLVMDPFRVRQCLTNVIGNAIKFTEHGSVNVQISITRDTSNRKLLQFTITDTGIGLDPEQQERLFKIFSQANASTTRKFGGTGLGLALSRNLARAMGGDLYLQQSTPGQGSTFVLTIGMYEVSPQRHGHRAEAQGGDLAASSNLHGVRVLLVEDAPDNQALIKCYLEMAGAEVAIAADGREGIIKALEGSHDLVLMDIQMPFVDGYEAAYRLRQSGYTKPVIALTANAMRGDKERSIQSGFTDHLSKPINPGALLKAVYSAARGASA